MKIKTAAKSADAWKFAGGSCMRSKSLEAFSKIGIASSGAIRVVAIANQY